MLIPKLPKHLTQLFSHLNQVGIRYVVLRGYLPITQLASEPDIDIFVEPSKGLTLREALATLKWRRVVVACPDSSQHFYEFWDAAARRITKLHIVTEVAFSDHGIWRFSGEGQIWAGATRDSDVSIPLPETAALLLALRLIWDKKHISSRHKMFFKEVLGAMREKKCPGPGMELIRLAEPHILSGNIQGLRDLREHSVASGLLRRGPRSAGQRIKRVFCTLAARVGNRVAARLPLRVAIVGPDGAGKSTLVACLRESIAGLSMGSAYLGHNDHVLGTTRVLHRAITHLYSGQAAFSQPRKVLAALVVLVYRVVWPIEIRKRLRVASRGNRLVLADRYPVLDDMPAAKYPMGRLMEAVVQAYTEACVPMPHIVFVCSGDGQTLWSRKKEHSYELFCAQARHYKRLLDDSRFEAHNLRTDLHLDETSSKLIAELFASPKLQRALHT
jgi:thymidylate kinase